MLNFFVTVPWRRKTSAPIIRWKIWDGRGSDMEANQIFPIEGIERILIVCQEQKRCSFRSKYFLQSPFLTTFV